MKTFPTVCHFFFQDENVQFTPYTASDTFTFTPPANIAGKACLMKLLYCERETSINYNATINTPAQFVYMVGIPSTQNVTVNPSNSYFGAIPPNEFLKVVGNDNRSNIIGVPSNPFSSYTNPDILVQVPPGPTEITLGIMTSTTSTIILNTQNVGFCISFTPIE